MPSDDPLDALATEALDGTGTDLAALATADLVRLVNDADADVAGLVRTQLPVIGAAVDAIAERMARGGRLVHVGAGTSGRLGVLDASEIPPTFGTPPGLVVGLIAGGPAALVSAVEGAEDDAGAGARDVEALALTEADTVVGIAASGRTPYVLGALAAARAHGCLTIAVSCNTSTPLSAAADLGIEVPVGPEVVRGSTRLRSGTATKMVLNTLSTLAMVRLGKTYGNLMVDLRATNEKLRRRAVRIVVTASGAGEDEAAAALAAADGHAKTAVAMLVLGVGAPAARAALEAAGGQLGDVVGHR
ncbi:N-acetylmuramic acid 6-phosphate etherase [Kineococcus rubinsiae]|uniref:N-acetylmuramic acid 6-phosphate etherase n=1 Tax=Kineococcus rubinsiae TaxID=2609562 RepID=UPI001431EE16|nr:N-acetylmuramic acid 6-phosphate etherase [Kineococcus rubinsiae]NIZ91630.1 N-acetylmuramic acid 6-phosphate etherase [Kineococcus rubinsiae]